MELYAFIAGVACTAVVFIFALRRAKKHPNGKTAKAIEIMGGGGPGSGELPK